MKIVGKSRLRRKSFPCKQANLQCILMCVTHYERIIMKTFFHKAVTKSMKLQTRDRLLESHYNRYTDVYKGLNTHMNNYTHIKVFTDFFFKKQVKLYMRVYN